MQRRSTISVTIGSLKLGSQYPIRVQSMTNTSTNDIEASVAQCRRIAEAGGELVRLTTQGVREANNLGEIRRRLREQGCDVPLVADVHFNPAAAIAAAQLTDKVRINPGNFVDPARTFKSLEYSSEEYAAELQRIEQALIPFIDLCRSHHTAVRLGVNHGSLSDRIMSRYGNTAPGMVESVMEFLRVFVRHNFLDVVISMKASNVVVMVDAVRQLVHAMDQENMHFPLHLGVTEAGFGEDGRIKSAVGIGALLMQGIGDTIRVSLSEEPEMEIPVARRLVDHVASVSPDYSITPVERQQGIKPVVVAAGGRHYFDGSGLLPDFFADELPDNWLSVDESTDFDSLSITPDSTVIIAPLCSNKAGAACRLIDRIKAKCPLCRTVLHFSYNENELEALQVKAGADFGAVLLAGRADGIWLDNSGEVISPQAIVDCAFSILQAARLRTTHTEFISCPGCGRTMFDLQETVKRVKAATAHLTHLKIGVMGCIVNGPGEMADADYGYVGAAVGKISLYKNKQCIEKNIPQDQAIDRLIELIKANGDWRQPTK